MTKQGRPRPPARGAAHPAPAVRATRSRSGVLLRDLARQLTDAIAILSDEPSTEAVGTALQELRSAREALSLLLLERAAPAPAPADSSAVLAAAPALVRRVQLEPVPTAANQARAFCRETCVLWGLAEAVVEAAVDVASELTANAARHGRSPLVLGLELRSDGLLVSVWDDGPGRPTLLAYRAGRSEHGIGLRLVKQLSDAWGWTDERDGKWVWARLAHDRVGASADTEGSGPTAR